MIVLAAADMKVGFKFITMIHCARKSLDHS